MATAWPSDAISSYLSGDDAKASLPEAVFDRCKVANRAGGSVDLGTVTGGPSTSYTYATAFDMLVPASAQAGDTLVFYFALKRTGGTTAYARVEETGVPTNGTEASTTSTSFTAVSSAVTIAAGWPGTVQNFKLGARGDGTATSDADSAGYMLNVKVSD